MKKTAIVLSVVFLVMGFVGIWVGAFLPAVVSFLISGVWVYFMPMLEGGK